MSGITNPVDRHDALKVPAPDGSEVTILSRNERGSMAEFRLPAGAIALAVKHKTVAELWSVQEGQGRIWLAQGEQEEILDLKPGRSFCIPVNTGFQFRNDGDVTLVIVAVTMPPWPGEDEAEFITGPWDAVLQA